MCKERSRHPPQPEFVTGGNYGSRRGRKSDACIVLDVPDSVGGLCSARDVSPHSYPEYFRGKFRRFGNFTFGLVVFVSIVVGGQAGRSPMFGA